MRRQGRVQEAFKSHCPETTRVFEELARLSILMTGELPDEASSHSQTEGLDGRKLPVIESVSGA